MSFEDIEFSFDNKCYVIQGINKDNSGQESNGSGKSSFMDIIGIALLGYSLTGRAAKDCVGWHSEESYFTVNCILENKEHELTCDISRKIFSNTKSSELVILVNGEVPPIPTKKGVKNGVDIRAGDEYILNSILDIRPDDLLNYFLISGKYYQPFLKVNTDKKLEVIARFTNTTLVDKGIKSLEIDLEENKDGIEENKNSIAQAEGYISALRDSMNEDAGEAFQVKKDNDLSIIFCKCEEIQGKILSLEEEVATNEHNINSTELYVIDLATKAELQTLLNEIDFTLLNERERQLNKEYSHISNHIAGLIECPNCSNQFNVQNPDEHFTTNHLADKENQIKEVRKEIEELKEQKKEISTLIDDIELQERENRKLQSNIDARTRTIESIRDQQARLFEDLEKLENEKDLVAGRTFADEKADTNSLIESKLKEIESIKLQSESIELTIAEQTKWIANFEDFKFYLGNKPLQMITTLVNEYLEFNGSDLNLQIEGFKKLKSGEVRQALNPVIYRNWSNPKDYNSFSEGEKTRLNISVDLAFQMLINNNSKFGGLDLYINDELCNPLDSLGIKSAAESFNDLKRTILLASHSGSDMNYSNTIVIEKKNGISKVL